APRDHTFTLGPNAVSESLTLESATRVAAQVVDQNGKLIPAKLQFIGIEGTQSPNFGPDSFEVGVRNLLYMADGKVSHPLAPGKYTVIASHGPEYDSVSQPLEVKANQVARLQAKLNRSVDTTGWVSGEFHSHSSPSGDNTSSQRGRVLNLLAENLEFAPCTEHNRVDSYAGHLTALKAVALMATCTGIEVTGSPLPVNHQNAFPLQHRPRTQDGGGPTTDADPVAQIQRLAMWDDNSDKVVQMNHPNLLQILGDRDLDGTADDGFRAMFDLMDVVEVHPLQTIFNTPSVEVPARERGTNRMFHWLQLLNLGYRTPGVVNTDAHYNWHGSGWLRNYIASSTDDPAKITTEEMIKAIQAGQMVMTTAPFLQVELRTTLDGQARKFISGATVPLGTAPARLWIRVQCANWYDINRVQIFANGRALPELNFTRATHGALFGGNQVRFEAEIDLPTFARDTHLIVATIGEGLTLGELMGTDGGKMPPVAVANPIYVDVDGGKFKPNGDNLGVPFMLPTGARTPATGDSSK
ncbi:MAG: CehA/McbA family metallohydrolase, partial [Pirellulaceae bacterium]|nr:CehA/McbA family metallohydrolase [Pirellulaceae bacterium]